MIKLPEPTAFSIFDYEGSEALYLMENNEELYKRYQQQDPKAIDNYCTIEAAKQAMRDVLEEAANLIATHAKEHAKLAMSVFHPGDQLALEKLTWVEQEIRKLKEQL